MGNPNHIQTQIMGIDCILSMGKVCPSWCILHRRPGGKVGQEEHGFLKSGCLEVETPEVHFMDHEGTL